MPRVTTAPSRERFEGEELKAYDVISKWSSGPRDTDGQQASESNFFPVLALSPLLTWAQEVRRQAVAEQVNRPNTHTSYEYHFTETVICFDSKYYDILPFHLEVGSEAGIRLEVFEALRDGREDLLTPDEAKIVDFVRRCVAGTLTDESYDFMKQRLGSDRGVYEYFYLIMGVLAAVRLHQAMLSEHPMTVSDVNDKIEELRRDGPPKGRLAMYEGMTSRPEHQLHVWSID